MHRQNRGELKQEIEQRLKRIISENGTTAPKKIKPRKFLVTTVFIAVSILLTSPLWLGFEIHSKIDPDPVYHRNRIRKVTIECLEGMEPKINPWPSRSGCAFIPQMKKCDYAKII